MDARTWDVVVVGGGPAGSVVALRLAQLGHRVCLIERARFPRRALGESLTPGVLPMLESIGAARRCAAGAERVHAVRTRWERDEDTERRDADGRGLLVDRGPFDATLLAHAREAGVEVLQPASVERATERADGWSLTVSAESGQRTLETRTIETRFLVDASGRRSRLSAKRRVTGPRTFAVHGYWRGRDLPTLPTLEACERGWVWGVPIPDGSYDTLAFVDAADVRDADLRDADVRDDGTGALDGWLIERLRGTSLASHVARAALDGPARIVDATPYLDEQPVTSSRLRVGDAAMALDPLSSSGVQKAIQTALAGAIVANTLLARPGDSALAIGFYESHLTTASSRHQAWTERHYATAASRFDSAFWRARAAPTTESPSLEEPGAPAPDDATLALSPLARWVEVPCLGERFVERRRALEHPSLEGPTAFVGGMSLAELLEGLPPTFTSLELAQRWVTRMPVRRGIEIARWLSARGVLSRA